VVRRCDGRGDGTPCNRWQRAPARHARAADRQPHAAAAPVALRARQTPSVHAGLCLCCAGMCRCHAWRLHPMRLRAEWEQCAEGGPRSPRRPAQQERTASSKCAAPRCTGAASRNHPRHARCAHAAPAGAPPQPAGGTAPAPAAGPAPALLAPAAWAAPPPRARSSASLAVRLTASVLICADTRCSAACIGTGLCWAQPLRMPGGSDEAEPWHLHKAGAECEGDVRPKRRVARSPPERAPAPARRRRGSRCCRPHTAPAMAPAGPARTVAPAAQRHLQHVLAAAWLCARITLGGGRAEGALP